MPRMKRVRRDELILDQLLEGMKLSNDLDMNATSQAANKIYTDQIDKLTAKLLEYKKRIDRKSVV